MGGGLLTMAAYSCFSDKQKIRANIAYGYLLMALSQLFILIVGKKMLFGYDNLIYVCLTCGVYYLLGRKMFALTSIPNYQALMTTLIIAFGFTVLIF